MGTFKNVVWPCITVIVICVAWLLINSDKVVDNVNTFKKWYGSSKALEGVWNNSTEGDLDPPKWLSDQKDSMEIRLTVENSLVDGTIITGKLRKLIPWDYVLLEGKKRILQNTLDVEAFDFIGGKRVSFGRFKIHLDGDKLIVDNLESNFHFFPESAALIKVSSIAFPELSHGDDRQGNKNPPKIIPDKNQVNSYQ